MGNVMQARLNNRKSHKAKGKTQSSWGGARIWHELLQNLRACSHMIAIRLLIVFGILFDWALCQVNFVMAYPQALIEMDM